jgi:flagellar basal-body rod protein FlgB
LFSDLATDTIQRALDGVSAQQQTAAADIANAATPGYKSKQVSFEDSLAAAAQAGDPMAAAISTTPTNTPADATGNTVSMTAETMTLTTAGLQYQALTQAMNFRLGLLHTAITS